MSAAAVEDTAPPSPSPASGFKLRRLEIENFKAIDHLELDLPGPLMDGDPDVFVIGSANGAGKTSLLEACALLWTSYMYRPLIDDAAASARYSLREYLIRTGASGLRVGGTFENGAGARYPQASCELALARDAPPSIRCELPSVLQVGGSLEDAEEFFLAPLFGASPRPFMLFDCMYFHSNRRIVHGPVEISLALSNRTLGTLGHVKEELLAFIMAQAGLLENVRADTAHDAARVLDALFQRFADARLSKQLRRHKDNAFDLRVQPLSEGGSFSFDALSSGQKEIISTLFLIWHHTRKNPSLVLIDEPELHLNAEWQAEFVHLLFKLAPHNQYILTTHSEFIFRSVLEDRRLLIGPQG